MMYAKLRDPGNQIAGLLTDQFDPRGGLARRLIGTQDRGRYGEQGHFLDGL